VVEITRRVDGVELGYGALFMAFPMGFYVGPQKWISYL
jgi:hypothetical protein